MPRYWSRCGIPLLRGYLQAGDVRFVPPLPTSKTAAINQLGMGVLNCLTLVFPAKFWPDDSHLWTPFSYGDLNIYDCCHCCKNAVLQVHRTGRAAARWETLSDAEIVSEAMDALRHAFPKQAAHIPAPLAATYTRWQSDPFSKGSYSFARVGGSRRSFSQCAQPVGTTLFFAGEHCHAEYNATVHGALMSARDTAKQVRQVFNFSGKLGSEQPDAVGKAKGKAKGQGGKR